MNIALSHTICCFFFIFTIELLIFCLYLHLIVYGAKPRHALNTPNPKMKREGNNRLNY